MFHRSKHGGFGCRFARRGEGERGAGPFGRGRFGGGGQFGGSGRFAEGNFRRGRVFDHGELRYVILALIAERPRHGYELIKEIEDRLSGAYSPSPGVIYPTLTMLEELGYATVAEEAGKKLYSITGDGQAFLAQNQGEVDAIFARMAATGEAANGGGIPQIMRATHNLKMALRLRLSRGTLTEEQVHAITAALDAAAVTIERS